MWATEQLQRVSDKVFIEPKSPSEEGRQLEWRRSFKQQFFKLQGLSVRVRHRTNKPTGLLMGDDEGDESASPWSVIAPDVANELALSAALGKEEQGDQLHWVTKTQRDSSDYKVERVPGQAQVVLRPYVPTKATNGIPEGIYPGNCYRIKLDDQDYLLLELTLPQEQLDALIATLERDPSAEVMLGVRLLAFSYEVDDFCLEPGMSQDLLVEDGAPAALTQVDVTRPLGPPVTVEPPEPDYFAAVPDKEEIVETPSRMEQLVAGGISRITDGLQQVKVALWALVIVLAVSLFAK